MNKSQYDKSYFDFYGGVGPYAREREEWLSFFAKVADEIKEKINPKKVLEVGCAKGFLVEALRDRGIDAFGIDISEYAISQVRNDIKDYCRVASASEPFIDSYDLVVCLEVLEHLTEEEGYKMIENICSHTSDIIFSSNPSYEHLDPTHRNVRPKEYWIRIFAENGFALERGFDASFIAHHAMRFKKRFFNITFISPGTGISGGVKVIFEYCNRLSSTGHHINLIVLDDKDINWFKLNSSVRVIHSSYDPSRFNKDIPDADIIIATWWETAPLVAQCPDKKGRKFYLIQHYESAAFSKPEYTDYTYLLPLQKIVVSSWLKTVIEDITGEKTELIFSGIDFLQFYPVENYRERYPKDDIRIGMIYATAKFKGFEDGLKSFEIVKKRYPNAKLIIMGSKPVEKGIGYSEFYNAPLQKEIKNFYNSLDVFVCPSRLEGFYLPGLEAMACGVTVVSTDAYGNRDYAIHGQTALISPPGVPEMLANNIIKIIEDKRLAQTLRSNAFNTAFKFTWEKAIRNILRFFVESESIKVNDQKLTSFLIDEISQTKKRLRQLERQIEKKREVINAILSLMSRMLNAPLRWLNKILKGRRNE